MRLHVVVPVYNEEAALPDLLPRLLALQQAADLDVTLVDGGSEDGTSEILRHSGLPWITTERGRAAQMNAGAQLQPSDAVLFLHADSRLPDDAPRSVRHALENGAVGGFFRVRLDARQPLLRLVGRMITWRSRITGIATGDQAIFVRRDVLDRLGGVPPLPLFEDVELCNRLRREGRLARLPQTVVTSARRWRNHGPWRTILRMWLLRLCYAAGLSPERLARYYQTAR